MDDEETLLDILTDEVPDIEDQEEEFKKQLEEEEREGHPAFERRE